MKQVATATWRGCVRLGEGTLSTSSGVISKLIYAAGSNDGETPCVTPGEMLAAAEAGCISLSCAREFELAHIPFRDIEVRAEVNIDREAGHPHIREIHLDICAHVFDDDETKVQHVLQLARENCLITRHLNCKITVASHAVRIEELVHA
jgi:lipoyl-dependent peroxiredoxin